MNETSEKILTSILRAWWLILLFVGAGVAAAVVAGNYFSTATYQATTSVYIKNYDQERDGLIGYNDLLAGELVATDVKAIMNSRKLLTSAAKTLGYETHEIFKDILTVQGGSSPRIVVVIIEHPNPTQAAAFANAIMETFMAQSAAYFPDIDFSVVDEAAMPENPMGSEILKNVILGGFAGAVIGVLLALLFAAKRGQLRSGKRAG